MFISNTTTCGVMDSMLTLSVVFISNTTTCGVMDSMLTLSVVFISNTTTCGVMDSMLTLSVVHLGFEPQSGQTKAKTIQLKSAAAPQNTQH
jgi:hypothetical protein